MIDNVTKPQCYNAFYARPKIAQQNAAIKEETPLNVKVGSAIGSAVCALGATYFIARGQSKALNKPVSIVVFWDETEAEIPLTDAFSVEIWLELAAMFVVCPATVTAKPLALCSTDETRLVNPVIPVSVSATRLVIDAILLSVACLIVNVAPGSRTMFIIRWSNTVPLRSNVIVT